MSKEEAAAILEPAATRVRDPRSGRSVWMAGLLQEMNLKENCLSFTLQCHPEHSEEQLKRMESNLLLQLEELGWKGDIEVSIAVSDEHPTPSSQASKNFTVKNKNPVKGMSGGGTGAHGGPVQKQKIPGVKNIIAIASGKGGVGKSTISTNLACALARQGAKVGLIDADVYGPSLPMMMKLTAKPLANDERQIIPVPSYGVKCMSMGMLVDPNEPIIWRGPMVMGAIRQFFQNVAWGELDYLLVDLPPGTGDAQLTMIQAVEISGSIIVTTPQDIAVQDAVRGVEMFVKLEVPILGIVENMSYLRLPSGEMIHPFGQGGGFKTAVQYNVPLLSQLPLDERIRLGGDMGIPVALSSDEDISKPFLEIAEQVSKILA